AIVVATSGSVTLKNLNFSNNHTQGGAGGEAATEDHSTNGVGTGGAPDSAVTSLLPPGFGKGGNGGVQDQHEPANGNFGGGGGGGGFTMGNFGAGGAYAGNGAGGGTHHGAVVFDQTEYGGGGGG